MPPTSAAPPAAKSGDLSPFVGDWTGHGRGLTIHADGTFSLGMRTYVFCGHGPPPCDTQSADTIVDGIRASGRLTAVNGTIATGQVSDSTGPSVTPVGPITMTLNPSTDSIETSGTNFCGENAPDGTCGA
jgi:hypothetical protein